ncbi:MAG: hypothetical protein IJG51_11805 [Synergistaceae bacterium]|nr:hypothetical protein [Synergistaceae bacterium]MBQ6665879.1 hypothetical protein [Synergistaceae bacterium]
MAYNVAQKATVGQLKSLAQRASAAIAAAIQALPTEMFLDQAKTAFIPNFVFNGTTYAGASNPNLDGKPVLVLAVKGIDHTNNNAETTTYSFLDVSTLVDTYTTASGDSSKVLTIAGYTVTFNVSADTANAVEVLNDGIAVKVSSTANNALVKDANGLFVDITGKADKATNPTAGHVAGLDANGNPTDTGIVAANVLTTADVATDAEVTEMLNEVFGAE